MRCGICTIHIIYIVIYSSLMSFCNINSDYHLLISRNCQTLYLDFTNTVSVCWHWEFIIFHFFKQRHWGSQQLNFIYLRKISSHVLLFGLCNDSLFYSLTQSDGLIVHLGCLNFPLVSQFDCPLTSSQNQLHSLYKNQFLGLRVDVGVVKSEMPDLVETAPCCSTELQVPRVEMVLNTQAPCADDAQVTKV